MEKQLLYYQTNYDNKNITMGIS